MSDIAIRMEGLSKQYHIGTNQGSYVSLRDTLTDILMLPVRWALKRGRGEAMETPEQSDTIWALQDVSGEIKRGEIVGVIGHNGAGKSTLLKIHSRITKPTTGFAEIYGRVGSLLEVGTGFHGELTGRENVYLNGSILGMKRAEIERKFDEIVAFAEVEKFVDTPVKHYSTGMYLRLAFAVAAHLEPNVLLVDEVLAVGDTRFYEKSIRKMRDLNAEGMTIVLVTHNMWLVQTVCSRAICLDKGHILSDGDPLTVIHAYRRAAEAYQVHEGKGWEKRDARIESNATMLLLQIAPHGPWAEEGKAFPYSGVTVVMVAQVYDCPKVRFLVRVASLDGVPYFTVYSDLIEPPEDGRIECSATIAQLMLLPGEYRLFGGICSQTEEEQLWAEGEQLLAEDAIAFQVIGNTAAARKFSTFWNQAHWKM
jgi:ABC-type polysaccharide/polyol phosphate transport system ATPase subunit